MKSLLHLLARQSPPANETERALSWLAAAAMAGAPAILVAGFARGPSGVALFAGVGCLAAIAGLAAGGILGLVFSLPTSGQQTVVVTQQLPEGRSGPSPSEGAPAPSRFGSPYGDNNSLSQIGSWLAGAIVALSIAQFDGLTARFDAAAGLVTRSMTASSPSVLPVDPAAGRPPAVPASESTQGAGEPVGGGIAPGALILGTYAMLGFMISYLWGRRYLAGELSTGQAEAAPERIAEKLRRDARSRDLEPASPAPPKASAFDAGRLRPRFDPSRPDFPEVRGGGPIENDPWKGMFGGSPGAVGMLFSAIVIADPGDPNLFLVDLRISSVTKAAREARAGQPVRLYLHPSYSRPIRMALLDQRGGLRMALVAYGAFTVGAQFADDTTLELDLAQLSDAPTRFRTR